MFWAINRLLQTETLNCYWVAFKNILHMFRRQWWQSHFKHIAIVIHRLG